MSRSSRICRCDIADKQQAYSYAQHTVSDVECGPVFARPIYDVDKITHESVVENSVVQIADYPRGEQRQGNLRDFVLNTSEKEDCDNHEQRNNRDSNQRRSSAGGYTEGCTGIFPHNECDEALYYRELVGGPGFQPTEHGMFAPQVKCCAKGHQRPEDQVCLRIRQLIP